MAHTVTTTTHHRHRWRPSGRAWTAVAVAGTLALGACTTGSSPGGGPGEQAGGTTQPAAEPNRGVDVALEATDSCDALLGWFHQESIDHFGSPGYPGNNRFNAVGGAIEDRASGPAVTTTPSASGREPTSGAPAPANAGESSGAAASGADGATPDYSGTNNQTKGVDEADLTKTDGRRLFGVVDGDVVTWDLTGSSPRQVGRLRLETGGDQQLLLSGDRLLVVTTGGSSRSPSPRPTLDDEPMTGSGAPSGTSRSESPGTTTAERPRPPLRDGPVTVLTLVDVGDLAQPKVLRRVAVEGSTVGARAIGGTVRLAVSTPPPDLPLVYPSGRRAEDAARDANRRIIESTTIADWLPQWVDLGASGIPDPGSLEGHPLVDCTAVNRPKAASGVGLVTLMTVPLGDNLEPGQAVSVAGAGETVYASPLNFYVSTTELSDEDATRSTNDVVAVAATRTAVHKFGIDGDGPATYRASGGVAGHLLNQFSMDETGADLRLATTVESINRGRTGAQSQVVVLREQDGELRQVGAVGGLGKGEQIKSVRFIGDVGYVVTFRQTDPLYTVDLRDPSNPKVAGELKILGYSAYLHPAGEGRIIGVGQDATSSGRTTGTQVALFDVSNPAEPRQIQQYSLPGSTSSAEQEHHAFLWWPATNLAVLPVTTSGRAVPVPSPCPPDANCVSSEVIGPDREAPRAGFVGALGLKVVDDGITEVGRIINPVDGVPAFGPDQVTGSTAPTTGSAPPATTSETLSPDPTVICDPGPCRPPSTTRAPNPTPPATVPGPNYSGAGAPILRTLVVGDWILSLSDTGLRTGHLDDLTFVAWEPLR